MALVRLQLIAGLLVAGISLAQASGRPKPLTTTETEARNETATPSFSGPLSEARRITDFLSDALVLNNIQQHAVTAYTVAERQALALAVTEADAALAQQEYLLAVRRVLGSSQLQSYTVLRQQFSGTMLPLDGQELAAR